MPDLNSERTRLKSPEMPQDFPSTVVAAWAHLVCSIIAWRGRDGFQPATSSRLPREISTVFLTVTCVGKLDQTG